MGELDIDGPGGEVTEDLQFGLDDSLRVASRDAAELNKERLWLVMWNKQRTLASWYIALFEK